MSNPNYALIMAGGTGSRFWPLSSKDYPKQFLDIVGTGQTLLQQTYSRFCKLVPEENIYVITSDDYVHIIEKQLPCLSKKNIIGEPMRKNTAPCVAYFCFKLVKDHPDASIIVAPSDQQVLDDEAFQLVCKKGLHFIEHHEALITLGIKPAYPGTGYGYIQKRPEETEPGVYAVKQYIEKPYLELAKSFLRNEDFLWNSGIFIWKIKDIMKAFQKYLPGLYDLFYASADALNTVDEREHITSIYEKCQDISIDFGIMEKSDNVYIIPASFKWSDLGTWNSIWTNMRKDEAGNAIAGKHVKIIDAVKCFVHAGSNKLVVLQGLDDFIVVDTEEVLLICRKEKEDDIKNYISEIKKEKEDELLFTSNSNNAA
jgi:mannose-1-phosphate guanylyltransferase